MSSPATGLFMSFGPCTVTPSGGPAITLPQVVDLGLGKDGEKVSWVADGGAFVSLITVRGRSRKLMIDTGQVALALSVPENTPCTVSVVLLDARNGTGTGALTLTLANAVLVGDDMQAQVNKFGQTKLAFEAYSSDGVADPLTVAAAP